MHDIRLQILESSPPSPARGFDDDSPKEKCGVFGVWGGPEPAHAAYLALYAQQHRGQESAGIAVSNGRTLASHIGMGLVPEVFGHEILSKLESAALPTRTASDNGSTTPELGIRSTGESAGAGGSGGAGGGRGCGAIGHNRYSTTGASVSTNAQPIVRSVHGDQVALAHNGNLINAASLRARFEKAGHLFHTTSDTEVIVHLLASPEQQDTLDPVGSTLRRLQGAYSLVMLFPDRVEAARDPWGWRPLVLGAMQDGRHVVASESVALDALGAQLVREIEPGEVVTLSDGGLSSRRFADPASPRAQCVFEHVYFASPASRVFGQSVQLVRESLGAKLADESPVAADYVMPMPDSGRSAANGFARASGIPYREGIVPNRYVGRTFIKPTQQERSSAVRLKLAVIREIVDGKKLIVVDDSIVRGTTTRVKMQQLRDAGAAEIHLRISCPPIRHPCYFGIDFATPGQLIAHERSVEQIREFLGVDSLAFLSLAGLLSCVKGDKGDYCTACYSGEYRLDPEHPTVEEAVPSPQMRMFEGQA